MDRKSGQGNLKKKGREELKDKKICKESVEHEVTKRT